MRYRVIRHPLVDRDIARIAAFLLEITTPRSVADKIAALDSDVDSLGENPHRGTRRDEMSPGLRAIPSAGNGVIAFEVNEESRVVRILSITWGGADWMKAIAQRAGSNSRIGENRRVNFRAAQPQPGSLFAVSARVCPASVPPCPALLEFPNLAESHQLVHLADR